MAGEVASRANAEHTLLLEESTLDPNMVYRWIRQDLVQRRRVQGYRMVSRTEDGVRTLLEDQHKVTDDQIYNGDAVLMCCDRRTVNERRTGRRDLNELRLDGPRRKFKEEARSQRVGGKRVRVIETDDEED